MDHFDEIIKPLLDVKIRIRNIERFKPRVKRDKHSGNYKAIITPMGRFESITAAAEAYGVTKSCISLRLQNNTPGYSYDAKH